MNRASLCSLVRGTSIVALVALTACRSSIPSYLDEPEHNLGVDTTWYGSNLRIYHSVLLYPDGLGLRSPGYIVGIENIHPSDAIHPETSDVRPVLREGHLITHIVHYGDSNERASPEPVTSCVLFTMLDRGRPTDDAGHRLFERCQPARPAPPDDGVTSNSRDIPIALLRQALASDLRSGAYSHILIMIMGWNTDQEKAVKSFNSIAGNLFDEARARKDVMFHPLIVGVTWPSQWQLGDWSVVPDAVVRGLSFSNKAHDADDIGNDLLRALIRDSVLAARTEVEGEPKNGAQSKGVKSPRIVLIGHSFGARALVKALAAEQHVDAGFHSDDRLILLQGAFEIYDLFDQNGDLNPIFSAGAPRVTMTASSNDSAVSVAIWGSYVGDIDTFDQVCRTNAEFWGSLHITDVGCGNAVRKGSDGYGFNLCVSTAVRPVSRSIEERSVRYFDASSMINCQAPLSSGGAHADILRRETARFLMDEMQ